MHDTRLAYAGTHPKFIAYLEGKGLSEDEIEYLCLYAMGFSGKEAGAFVGRKAHYNFSAEIRKKLGLESSSVHLSRFVRDTMNSVDFKG